MKGSARVLSVETLDELRFALEEFSEQATTALEMVDGQIRRTESWLEQQLQYWRAEARRLEEAVFIAKQELARKKMRQSATRPVDCTEEEKALKKAQQELWFAEDKIDITRRWLQRFPQELIDYEGPARNLKTILEGDTPRACALLADKANILAAYLQGNSPEQKD